MSSYPIITKKSVKSNDKIKKIQKEAKKKYGKRKLFGYPKASIPKIIVESGYVDIVDKKVNTGVKINELNKLLVVIEENELTGMSGNGFPTYKKLKTAMEVSTSNKVLIINGAECDPGLIHDAWLIRNRLKDIIFGSKLVGEMINASDVFLAAKLMKNESIEGINVKNLPNRYPIGAEKILIKEVLGVEMDKKDIPVKKGILVLNVQTIIMIAEMAKGEFSKGSRYITVADYTNGEAKVAKVTYDMKSKEVLEKVLGKQTGKVIYAGGGVMGAHKVEEDERITPLTNFVGYADKVAYDNGSKCKKCGNCSRNCPMGIKVHKVVADYGKSINSNMQQYGVQNCINCGTCTYLCQAGKNTMEIVNMYSNK